jgi:Ca2+-binding EF-hand superfamily protein
MKKLAIFGAAAAALIAVPTIAQIGRDANSGGIARTEIPTKVREGFLRIDRDRDGFVTQAEADSYRTSIRGERRDRRQERREARFDRLDRNRDGAISRDEFFASRDRADRAERREDRRGRRAERRERRMERRADRGLRFGPRAFERMDSNRDGRVSLAEATEHRLRRFDRVDANRDGRISREERRSFRSDRRRDRA